MQDADELYNTVLSCLASQLQASSTRLDMGTARNVVDGLFEVEMDVRCVRDAAAFVPLLAPPCWRTAAHHARRCRASYKCLESDDEPEVKRQETARKLVCNIAGGASGLAQVNHLHEGVMLVRALRTRGIGRSGERSRARARALSRRCRAWRARWRSSPTAWAATRSGRRRSV